MTDVVKEKARSIIRRYKTRDPFELCDKLGVTIRYCSNFGKLKGMYRVILGNRYIFLNANLSDEVVRIVLAHELGHDSLHRKYAADHCLQEYGLFDAKSQFEYEANVFAACILLPPDEVYSLAMEGYTIESIACQLNTDVNLVALKITEMRKEGYPLNTPNLPKSDFLK